jgi:hypothetical protein
VTKLNQVLAVIKTVKGDTEKALTGHYHTLQKPALLSGLSRSYAKLDDADPDLPSESTLVQVKTELVLQDVAKQLGRLFDVTAARDWTNCTAKANVVVDGTVLIEDAPVTYLLFLEKALLNVETFIRKLPTLDPAEDWHPDPSTDTWRTPETRTARTKKIKRNHVKAPATDKHPAQVEVFDEDTIVGYWKIVKFSGALPAKRVNEMLGRVTALAEAVKFAREHANATQVSDPKPGSAVFDYLFQ